MSRAVTRPPTPPAGSLARLARRIEWLPREEVATVLAEQRRTGRPFAEVALRRGVLTPSRLAGLLALQRQLPETLAADLFGRGLLTEGQGKDEVREYYASLRDR
jgi:hypothetical protein